MTSYHFNFDSDYLEFYLLEERATQDIYRPWPPEAVEHNLQVLDGALGIRTYPSMGVVTGLCIQRCSSPPPSASGAWHRINECSLSIHQGPLLLAYDGWDVFNSRKIVLAAGDYRVRIYYGDTSSLDAQFNETRSYVRGEEKVYIELWPAPLAGLVVLKSPSEISPRPEPPAFCHRNTE